MRGEQYTRLTESWTLSPVQAVHLGEVEEGRLGVSPGRTIYVITIKVSSMFAVV